MEITLIRLHMVKEVNRIELADGTKLEIRTEDEWFKKPEIKEALKRILVASRVDKTKSVVRFFFVHRSYFRAFDELGLPLLFMPIVSNYAKYRLRISDIIQKSKETANVEFYEFGRKIYPIIMKAFINPLSQWLEEIESLPEISEDELKTRITLSAIEKLSEATSEKDEFKRLIKRYVSPEVFVGGLDLAKTLFYLFCNTLTEKGLERYTLLSREICDQDIELCNKVAHALIECGFVTPLITVSVCVNKYCNHTEVTISDRIPEAICGKCNKDTLTVSFAIVNEPYLWLKDMMLDLHALLYLYVDSKSIQKYAHDKLESDLQCFLNSYVRNISNGNEREVDALLYSTKNKTALGIEIKIHQVRSQLPSERLRAILTKDLKQLIETIRQLGLKTGCYITNLKIPEEEAQHIEENVIPQLAGSRMSIEIISAVDETTFLNGLNALIEGVQKRPAS